MSNKKKSKIGTRPLADGDEKALLSKMTRLLEILVRLNLHTMRAGLSHSAMISMLGSVGCGQTEIADLLGTTPNTVNVALYKAKSKARKK